MARAALLAVAVAAAVGPAAGRGGCPEAHPGLMPPGGIAALERLRDEFAKRAGLAGRPALREATGPRLLAFDPGAGAVDVPRWEELPTDERVLLADMAGSAAQAPELFVWLYRWFYLPRALAEALLAARGAPLPDALLAEDLGIAFLASQPLGPERLARVRGLLDEALARLASEVGDPGAAARRGELVRARAALARGGRQTFEALLAGAAPRARGT